MILCMRSESPAAIQRGDSLLTAWPFVGALLFCLSRYILRPKRDRPTLIWIASFSFVLRVAVVWLLKTWYDNEVYGYAHVWPHFLLGIDAVIVVLCWAQKEKSRQHRAFAQRIGLNKNHPLIAQAYATLSSHGLDSVRNLVDLQKLLRESTRREAREARDAKFRIHRH